MCLLALLDILQTELSDTLDLINPKTLKWLFGEQKTKHDCNRFENDFDELN